MIEGQIEVRKVKSYIYYHETNKIECIQVMYLRHNFQTVVSQATHKKKDIKGNSGACQSSHSAAVCQ